MDTAGGANMADFAATGDAAAPPDFSPSFDATSAARGAAVDASADPAAAAAAADAVTSTVTQVAVPLGHWPSDAAMALVDFIHTAAHLPYWQAIVAATVGLRLALLPLQLNSMRIQGRLQAAKPEMQAAQAKLMAQLDAAKAAGVPPQSLDHSEMQRIFEKHGVKMPMLYTVSHCISSTPSCFMCGLGRWEDSNVAGPINPRALL
jgi:hypothetical protein